MYLDQIWVRLWNTAVRGVYFWIPFHNDCRPPWCFFFEVGSIEGDIRFVQSWFTEEWQGHHEENAAENSQQERVIRWSETWTCMRLYWLVHLFWNLKGWFHHISSRKNQKGRISPLKVDMKSNFLFFFTAQMQRAPGSHHHQPSRVGWMALYTEPGRRCTRAGDENGYPGISSERPTKNCWSFWCPTPVSLKTEVVIMATTWAELHVWLLMGCQNVTCEFMFWCLMFWWNSVVQKHLSFVKLWVCDSFEAILQRHSCRKSSKRRAHFIVSFGHFQTKQTWRN